MSARAFADASGARPVRHVALTRRARVLVTGGGTAGHVEPAIAVAKALESHGIASDEILFVGARRGMEATLVPDAGYRIRLLPGRGILRRLSLANVRSVLELGVAFVQACAIVIRERPKVVVSVGGYAGLASSFAALLVRVPVVVVNVDSTVGASNRLVGRFAAVAAVASSTSELPRTVVTGPPVRPAVLAVQRDRLVRERARATLGLPADRRVLAVVGGSLGAGRLNDAALALRAQFAERSDLVLYHVAGARNLEQVSAEVARTALPPGGLDYRLVGFEAELPSLLAAADLVVSRAGAMTVAELEVIGAPSVLVPLPRAPGDHQHQNAESLARAGAAVVIEDENATGTTLVPVIEELLGDPARLTAMGEAATRLARPRATEEIASLVAAVMNGKRFEEGSDPR